MKYQDNINAVAALQPDYLGFIFYEKSARFFNGIIPELAKNIKKTGVFVNASTEYIIENINKYDLQAVQLHGAETPEFCDILRQELVCLLQRSRKVDSEYQPVEIIKVFPVKGEFDFSILEPYEDVCDYYLFDTKGKLPGGNGYTFNWEVLKEYPSTKPYFLSGGIGLAEVDNILSFLRMNESKHCYAIDVNSKFEIEPGFKKEERLKEFIDQLNR